MDINGRWIVSLLLLSVADTDTANRPFPHSRFYSTIRRFYRSYFPYNGQNGIHSTKCNGKENNLDITLL